MNHFLREFVFWIVPRKIGVNLFPIVFRPPMTFSDQQRELFLKKLYRKNMGKSLDFENPKTFNEKIQWYKLYYNHPDFSRMLCKVQLKHYLDEKIGENHVAKLYGAWTNTKDIDFKQLPDSFVLKSNCSSDARNIIIVKDKHTINEKKIKRQIDRWLWPSNTLLQSACRGYYGVTPMILAEEYLTEFDKDIVPDYKFYCFCGKVAYVLVCSERVFNSDDKNPKTAQYSAYDLDWNQLDTRGTGKRTAEFDKPKNFSDMVALAEKLSAEFPFVRVDFFGIEHRLLLSELTFYSGGGFNRFSNEFDHELGEKFILPEKTPLGKVLRPDLGIRF